MVHALREARRVLKRGGIVVDLRPAVARRRVGVVAAGRYRFVGVTGEDFEVERAANKAVAKAIQERLFERVGYQRFDCRRVADNLANFRAWLDRFVRIGGLSSHDWLMDEVTQAVREAGGPAKIVIEAPVEMRLLARRERTTSARGTAQR